MNPDNIALTFMQVQRAYERQSEKPSLYEYWEPRATRLFEALKRDIELRNREGKAFREEKVVRLHEIWLRYHELVYEFVGKKHQRPRLDLNRIHDTLNNMTPAEMAKYTPAEWKEIRDIIASSERRRGNEGGVAKKALKRTVEQHKYTRDEKIQAIVSKIEEYLETTS